ncbi:MAG TPA: 3-hydroxylacyl-ACP dehydratase [Rhodocyclaceae bacterium]|nr:3-hydroxylacyl-ACP dehydratase [Rhodocyclaceae bacterium]
MPQLALNIPVDHPAFAGHFPQRPIVPGVVLLDAGILLVEAHCGRRVTGLTSAKFLSPAGPGEALTIDFSIDEREARFDILAADRKVASGRMRLALSSPA